MHPAVRTIVLTLYHSRIIGAKHTPEKRLVQRKFRYLNKQEKRIAEREYTSLVQARVIIRQKKMTGKKADWHISLNPRKLTEIQRIVEVNHERKWHVL